MFTIESFTFTLAIGSIVYLMYLGYTLFRTKSWLTILADYFSTLTLSEEYHQKSYVSEQFRQQLTETISLLGLFYDRFAEHRWIAFIHVAINVTAACWAGIHGQVPLALQLAASAASAFMITGAWNMFCINRSSKQKILTIKQQIE